MLVVDPRYLLSIRAQTSYTWQKMLCELIDNSFDADASIVKLSFPGGKVFGIEDNGNGCRDLGLMLNLGTRLELDSNDIGKYGVGCKLAMIWLWGRTEIQTCYKGQSKQTEVNWEEVAFGREDFPPVILDGISTEGTSIKCFSDRVYPKNLPALFENIASTYTPAIESGRKILVNLLGNSNKLAARKWPVCEVQDQDIVTAAGRSVSVRMGVVSEGVENPYNKGFSFERTYRVIIESALGSGGYSTSRIAARILLGKEWDLSTNKDDLLEYQDELADAIYNRFEELIKHGSEQAVTFEDDQFNKELAAVVKESVKARREKRPGELQKIGTVEPKHTGKRRTSATVTSDEPGSVLCETRTRGFSVATYYEDSLTFGYYDRLANKVFLNTGNEWLQRKHREKNFDALIPVIYGIVSDYAVRHEQEKIPLFKDQVDNFGLQWGMSVAATVLNEVVR